MESIIGVVAVGLVLAYIGFAIWFICTRQTVGKSIGASAACICGGFVVIPLAQVIAAIVCWGVLIILVLAILACGASGK